MRPEDEAADSELESILNIGGIDRNQSDRFRLEQDKVYQYDLNDYCAIIAGGSPFDVSTPLHKKSLAQQRVETFFNDLFDKVVDLDFPFLGACSGNGLLGNYCGATISRTYSEPVGIVQVSKTKDGQEDPLLNGLPTQFSAFVGHKEACDQVPVGAKLLLTSQSCPVQMFRVKNNIYATQFHPEADSAEFVLRIKIYQNFGYFDPKEANTLISAVENEHTPHSNEILKRFVTKYLRLA